MKDKIRRTLRAESIPFTEEEFKLSRWGTRFVFPHILAARKAEKATGLTFTFNHNRCCIEVF